MYGGRQLFALPRLSHGQRPALFESRRRYGGLFHVSVVCCQVEVSVSGWPIVLRSLTEWWLWVWSWSFGNEVVLAHLEPLRHEEDRRLLVGTKLTALAYIDPDHKPTAVSPVYCGLWCTWIVMRFTVLLIITLVWIFKQFWWKWLSQSCWTARPSVSKGIVDRRITKCEAECESCTVHTAQENR
jgi:hypothetical protein